VIVGRDRRKTAVPGRIHGFRKATEREVLASKAHQRQVHTEVHRADRSNLTPQGQEHTTQGGLERMIRHAMAAWSGGRRVLWTQARVLEQRRQKRLVVAVGEGADRIGRMREQRLVWKSEGRAHRQQPPALGA
jgi:hypothetical protein